MHNSIECLSSYLAVFSIEPLADRPHIRVRNYADYACILNSRFAAGGARAEAVCDRIVLWKR
jgi:hypothetical protein